MELVWLHKGQRRGLEECNSQCGHRLNGKNIPKTEASRIPLSTPRICIEISLIEQLEASNFLVPPPTNHQSPGERESAERTE